MSQYTFLLKRPHFIQGGGTDVGRVA